MEMKIEISNKKLKELLFKKEIAEIKKLKEEVIDLKTQLRKVEQPPTEEKTIIKKQKNQFGEYKRTFKIKI